METAGYGKGKNATEISFMIGFVKLQGIFSVPSKAYGVVLFAHGSGSGRLSPRNMFVAQLLHKRAGWPHC